MSVDLFHKIHLNISQNFKNEGQLLAPINVDDKNQKFTILHKTEIKFLVKSL